MAAIGSGAIAELLRIVRAAEKGETVRLPRHLPTLLRVGLVRADSEGLITSALLPTVPRSLRWRFTPSLHDEHARWKGSAPRRQDSHQAEGNKFADGEGSSNP